MKNQLWMLMLIGFPLLFSCNRDDKFNSEEDDYDQYDEGDPEQMDEGSLTLYTITEGMDIEKKKDFNVSGELINYQQDYAKHLKMWDFVKRLLPERERQRITEFMVFYGENDLAGYVSPVDINDLSKWQFGMAIELAENIDEIDFENFFTYVTVHELGHIVTLNETQLDAQALEEDCGNYYPGEGCAESGSYINKLYELGWSDIYQGEYSEEDLYGKYPERFVSDYAATNPAEDIAEVFSHFITKADFPTGNSVAQKKIKLLYDFPKLVSLRDEIRQNPVMRAVHHEWTTTPSYKNYRVCSHKKGHRHAIPASKN